MRWLLSLVILAGGAYFLMQHWPATPLSWDGMVPHWNNPTGRPSGTDGSPASGNGPHAGNGPNGLTGRNPSSSSSAGAVGWRDQAVNGLKLNLPFPVEPFTTQNQTPLPAYIIDEHFRGQVGARIVFVEHAENTRLVGTAMLAWADKIIYREATRIGMQVMSSNTATTVIHGLRARRSDLISIKGNPRVRGRCVLLEKGSHLWFVECHAPETDPEAEGVFLRIATSAQPF